MKCNDKKNSCNDGCLWDVPGTCMFYTDVDTDFLQIPNGMNFNDIVLGLDSALAALQANITETDNQTLSLDIVTGKLDISDGNYVVIPLFKGINIADTPTGDLQGNGYDQALRVNTKISTLPGNTISAAADGIYSSAPVSFNNGLSFDVGVAMGQLGGPLVKNTVITPTSNFTLTIGDVDTSVLFSKSLFSSTVKGLTSNMNILQTDNSFTVNNEALANMWSVNSTGQLRASAYTTTRTLSNLGNARVFTSDAAGNIELTGTLNGVSITNGLTKTGDSAITLGGTITQNTNLTYGSGSLRLNLDMNNRYALFTNGRVSIGNIDYANPISYNLFDINAGAGVTDSALQTTTTNQIVSIRTGGAAATGSYVGVAFGLNRDNDAGAYLKGGVVYQASTGDITNRYGDILFVNRTYEGAGNKTPFDVNTDTKLAIRNDGRVEIISGSLQLANVAADPVTGSENGDLYYNTVANKLRAYENGLWKNVINTPQSSTRSGNSVTTTFTIPHNLAFTPTSAVVTPNTLAAIGDFYATVDALNLNIIYSSAPATGSNNLVWSWIVT